MVVIPPKKFWNDDLGRTGIKLAGFAFVTVARQNNHTQNFASAMRASIIRALLGRCDASHAPRSTLITPSVKEYRTLTQIYRKFTIPYAGIQVT